MDTNAISHITQETDSNRTNFRRGIFAIGGMVTVVLVLLLSSFLLFYHLGMEPLQDYDESTYSEISTEGLISHNYFALTFLNESYFKKPPLVFWLMEVSESHVHNQEVAARLPTAIAGLLLIALVMLFVYEVTENPYAGAAAGAVLATTSAFIEPSRQARFDTIVSFFIIAAVYSFYKAISKSSDPGPAGRSFNSRGWFLVFGIFIGLTLLTKGPLIVYAIVPALVIAAAYRAYKWLLDPYFWGSILAFFIVTAPWFLYESFHYGFSFWYGYLDDEVFDRIGQMLFEGPTNGQYLGYLFSFALPWAPLFFVSIVVFAVLWRGMTTKARALSLSSVIGVLTIIAICFIAKTKAFSYFIPLYPFIALTVGLGVYEVIRRIKLHTIRTWIIAGFFVLIFSGLDLSIYNGFHLNSYYTPEVTLAQNEKGIAEKLISEHATNFYVENVTTLGSIMFYTRLLDPLGFTIGAIVPANSFLLFPTTDLDKIESAYPKNFIVIYTGSSLDLGEFTSA